MNPNDTPAALRVCMVSDDFLPGATGVGTHVQAVSARLAERGHAVSIITTRRSGEPEFEVWQGVRVHRVPTVCIAGFYQGLPGRRRIERILDQEQPQVIHQHYLGVMLMRVSAAARRRGLKQVYTHHMTVDHLTQPWFMRPWRGLISRQIAASANQMDLVISVSKGIARTLPAAGFTRPVVVVSNPVAFPDPALAAPAARDGGFVVFFAGRLEPEKNLPLLLRGFAEFARQRTDAVLWLAGRGSLLERLRALAASLGIGQRVHFLGFLDATALASRYAACDLFVLPSLVETQGLVAMEAAWYGKPVLVADSVASCHELVPDTGPGVNGEIFDHREPAALARCLQRWADDAPGLAAAGRRGQQLAAQWAPERVMPQLIALYQGQVAAR